MLHHFFCLRTALTIVPLPVDVPAGSVLSPLQPRSLPCSDSPIGFRSCFGGPRPRLLSLKPESLASRQRAAPYSVPNSTLLPMLTPINARRSLRQSGGSKRNYKYYR